MFFVDRMVARRLEAAYAWRAVEYAQAQARLHPDWGSAVEPVAGGYAVFAGVHAPVNRAKGLGMNGPVAADDITLVERFFRQRGVPPGVDVCPLADPTLVDLLCERGYRLEGFHNLLALPLTGTRDLVASRPEIRVAQVGPNQSDLWLRVVAAGFADRDEPPPDVIEIIAPTLHSTSATCFLAWVEGQPVGGAALIVHQGVAELGSDSTLPAFRGRGVQTALVRARLTAARRQGCNLAIVVTSPGSPSQLNLERAGFRMAYTTAMVTRRSE